MSGWDAYITSLKDGAPEINSCAIVGCDDGGIWAKSDAFSVTTVFLGINLGSPDELSTLAKAFNDVNSLPSTGFRLQNTKFIVPRTEEYLVFGKQGSSGVFAFKSDKAIVIALYEGEREAGAKVRGAVERIGNHLKSVGY